MIYTIHAGHNPSGKIACGASDYLDESTQARYLVKQLCKKSKSTTYNCTVSDGKSQSDILKKICDKCNSYKRDIDISIHFNACSHEEKANGKVKGTEVWVYSTTNRNVVSRADKFLKNMEKLGYTNRGVKESKNLYFLKNTVMPSMLIEVCFVDDKDDYLLYKKTKDKIIDLLVKMIDE